MSTSLLPLLSSLPFSHPSTISLLQSHKPFANPSHLSQSSLAKLLSRLNSSILSREDNVDRRAACDVAKEIIEMDEEGYILSNYGKGWLGTCLGFIASPTSTVSSIPSYLSLLQQMVYSASQYPSFEREVIHPIMGKLAASLGKLFERCISDSRPDWNIVYELLSALRKLIVHSPAPFRPLLPVLKPSLLNLILQIPTPTNPYPVIPDEIRRSASELIACLHVMAGKAQSPQSWGTEVREALGGFGRAMNGITADAWEEESVKVQPPNAASALPELPVDSSSRLPVSLDWAEGFAEVILALLRYPTARPVPVPIAQIVSAGLRCLSLTLDTPVSLIDTEESSKLTNRLLYFPQHHAALLASLPRIWTIGVQLIGSLAISCGDHLFPHLSNILDHTVWLAERIPAKMTDTQIQLLKFHHLLLSIYPPAIVPLEYPTRLLRLSLTRVQPLLENRSKSDILSGNTGGGKRGKKRARGAEDGLVGGLEGRESRSISSREVEVIVMALHLIPLLHPTPLLSPSLLTFSVRLHLSLYLSLTTLRSVLPSSAAQSDLRGALNSVLERAVLMTEGEGGTGRGWKSLIISVLEQQSENLALVIHPSLPPLMRPLPPLSQLHFFVKEGEEERKERLGMGFGVSDDVVEEEEEEDMIIEKTTSRVSSNVNSSSITTEKVVSSTTFTHSPINSTIPTTIPSSMSTAPPTVETIIRNPDTLTIPSSTSTGKTAVPAPEIPTHSSIDQTVSQTIEVASNFISQPTSNESKGKNVANTEDLGDVIMLNNEDEEGIPDLDSGSDDFDEDEDEDEDEVEEDD